MPSAFSLHCIKLGMYFVVVVVVVFWGGGEMNGHNTRLTVHIWIPYT